MISLVSELARPAAASLALAALFVPAAHAQDHAPAELAGAAGRTRVSVTPTGAQVTAESVPGQLPLCGLTQQQQEIS